MGIKKGVVYSPLNKFLRSQKIVFNYLNYGPLKDLLYLHKFRIFLMCNYFVTRAMAGELIYYYFSESSSSSDSEDEPLMLRKCRTVSLSTLKYQNYPSVCNCTPNIFCYPSKCYDKSCFFSCKVCYIKEFTGSFVQRVFKSLFKRSFRILIFTVASHSFFYLRLI